MENSYLQLCSTKLQHVSFSTNRARTSGPVLVRLGLSPVGGGFSPCRQAEEILCTPCPLRPQLCSLFACDPHCTSVGLHTYCSGGFFLDSKAECFSSVMLFGKESCISYWIYMSFLLHCFTAALWVISGSPVRESKSSFSLWMVLIQLSGPG